MTAVRTDYALKDCTEDAQLRNGRQECVHVRDNVATMGFWRAAPWVSACSLASTSEMRLLVRLKRDVNWSLIDDAFRITVDQPLNPTLQLSELRLQYFGVFGAPASPLVMLLLQSLPILQ